MFSDIAVKKMMARFNDSNMKVGRDYTKHNSHADFSKYTVTDCITFAVRVLKETFAAVGQPKVVSSLIPDSMVKRGNDKKAKFYGDMLGRKLVAQLGWKAIYITPDELHPNDGSREHTYSTAMVGKYCAYVGIPVSYTVLNYRPTPKTDSDFQKLYPHNGVGKLNTIGLSELYKIKFGYGISRSGDHIWLFSKGYVYEAHSGEKGKDIFDKTRIENFIWNSSLIIVPPDSFSLLDSKKMKDCA